MSRSYKKNDYCGHAGDSDKQDKRIANRRLRSSVRDALMNEKEVLPILKEKSNPDE